MFAKILIILFVTLPLAHSFAANPKSNFESSKLRSHLASSPNDSRALFNLALNEQKEGRPALSLALTERSRFLDPFNLDAIKLNSISYDQLSDKNNERMPSVPFLFKILDFIPYFLLLLLCLASFALFAWQLGLTFYQEKVTYKTQPSLRLRSSLAAALAIMLIGLLTFKSLSQSQTWACVVSNEAGLFTGPSSETYTKVSSLSAGTCSKVVRIENSWVSLAPEQQTSGWALKSQVVIVRTNKFDPLFKSD